MRKEKSLLILSTKKKSKKQRDHVWSCLVIWLTGEILKNWFWPCSKELGSGGFRETGVMDGWIDEL